MSVFAQGVQCSLSCFFIYLLPQVTCPPQKAQGTAAQMLQQCWEQMAGAVQDKSVQC